MNNITRNTIIEVDINTTSFDTIKRIADILIEKEIFPQNSISCEKLAKTIENGIGKELVNEEGKFTKRLRKFIKVYFGINIPNDILSKIGTIIGTIERQVYTLEIKPPPFNWKAGEFGDYNSCFWGDKEIHKRILESCGYAYAVLFYKNGEKYGRIWLIVLNECQIAFNPYSIDNSLSLETAGIILSKAFNMKHKIIGIKSCIYINQNKGIALYANKEPLSIMELSFGIICEHCKQKALTEIHEYNSMLVCDECYDELLVYCVICGKEIENTNSTTIITQNALGHIYEAHCCYDCLYRYCESCVYCGEKFDKNDMWQVNIKNIYEETVSSYVCPGCLIKHCDICEHCYTIWGVGEAKNNQKPFLCPICKTKINKQERRNDDDTRTNSRTNKRLSTGWSAN